MKKIPFSPPDIGEEEIKEVIEVLNSGWITTGPKTKEFEKKIAEYVGVNRAVCLNSATACEELALRLLGFGEEDEIIVPAYTYTATASPAIHVGAKVVMIDSQEHSLEMDYAALENAINENTKAIIAVDIAGIICDYDKIYEIVNRKKSMFKPKNEIQKAIGRIVVFADAAHSFGASKNGKMAGSIADFSSFSFHAVKNLTVAEGGALTWKSIDGIDDEDIYKQLQLYSLHGQSKDALSKSKLGSWEYDVVGAWYKCNMTDISAAMGLVQFKRYDGLLQRRRNIINMYDEGLKNTKIKTLKHYDNENISSGHLYITRVGGIDEDIRNQIIIEMAKENISTNVHYKPLPMMSAYKNLGFDISNYPRAYSHYKNAITLPLHTSLTNGDVEYIIQKYIDIVEKYVK